ncbi:MAG TPA: hypothetical protein VGG21_08720 [Acidimicrobiales bacterium]|jgi:hypothetical protein
MTLTADRLDVPTNAPTSAESAQVLELLFKEARERARKRRLRWLTIAMAAFVAIGVVAGLTYGAGGSTPRGAHAVVPLAATTSVKMLTCGGAEVARPVNYVISCADANAQLTKTTWTTWSSTRAVGTTDFALNQCNPNCASSKMTFLPHSTVLLTSPVTTKHGRLFEHLSVRYVLAGKVHHFNLSFKGDPSFEK